MAKKSILNKQKQAARREVRKQFGEGLETLGKLIYTRPKWCPKFIFILLFVPSFTPKALKFLWRHI